jgi:hypothetical protein
VTQTPNRQVGRHRRKRTLGAAAIVTALLGGLAFAFVSSVATAPASSALAKIKCKQTTGTGEVDPIVHHNEPAAGSAHLHQFFGNNSFLTLSNPNTANYQDLRSGGTNCVNPKDTAGYWTPVLRYKSTGKIVPTQAFTAYYRSWDFKTTGAGVPLPDDVRLVASQHSWTCGQFESVKPQAGVPDCSMASGSPGSTLTAHVDFPSCWDGVKPSHSTSQVGDTNDNKHFAYRTGSTCPAGFPVKTVQLRETLQFQYTGTGNDVELSSDHEKGTTDGMSLHGDFWNAWDPAGMASMVKNCVNPGGTATAAECG